MYIPKISEPTVHFFFNLNFIQLEKLKFRSGYEHDLNKISQMNVLLF